MYRVLWDSSLKATLLALWLETESTGDFSRNIASIEEALSTDPLSYGESRRGEERVAIFPPLTILYEVDETSKTVVILAVRLHDRST